MHTSTRYTHLHVHSHYTLLGGTASVHELAQRAAEDGLSHLALTDTHALYGAVAFAQACAAVDIQPIIGMVVRMQPPSFGGNRRAAVSGGTSPDVDEIVLLAQGPAGYRSLCALSSELQGDPHREEALARGLSWSALKEHRAGLLCIVGGRRSRLAATLAAEDQAGATRYLAQVAGIFDDCAYVAVEVHGEQDREKARTALGLAERLGLAAVALQPVYCLLPADRPRLRLLAAIDHNCLLQELPPHAMPDFVPDYMTEARNTQVRLHWPAPEEMTERFASFEAALASTHELACRCGPALPDGRPVWPVLPLPPDQTPAQALTEQTHAGLRKRYADAHEEEWMAQAAARLEHELTLINRQGFAPYFLLVADIVAFARRRHIPVSTRGSVANSLAAYCLEITTVDPLEHDLLFERFLNPARSSPPDIDLDFCSARRDEVLEYVRATYGADRVALLATVSTMRPKSALRETAKAYGADEKIVERLIRRLPDRWHPDPERRIAATPEALLEENTPPLVRRIVEDAFAILGQPHHLSIHPGGVVVTPGPLTEHFPVQWTPKGFLISQFAHDDMEALGLPKMDLLGIRALTVLADTAELVRRHAEPEFRLEDIPLHDARTGKLLAAGDTVGIFQCDSNGARRTLRQLQARTVRDLAVANAFFKPGPATGGMAASFIRRYRGEEKASYLHPALTRILRHTQGVLLFQEQILRVAVEIAGLDWQQADHLRRGMSKFDTGAMEAMAAAFVDGCCRAAPEGPALTSEQARRLWEQVRAFAGYGFNQGHATAYADVSYRSAYLKAHWPAQFFAARLANYGGFHHPAVYIAEAIVCGIDVRPPHVNHSETRFSLAYHVPKAGSKPQPVLWMGLEQVNSLRRETCRALIQGRQNAPYTCLDNLLARVSLQARELTHLIQCGALDGLGASRAALLAQAENQAHRPKPPESQLAFDFGDTDDRRDGAETSAISPETPAQRLAWERRILGFPVSVHPLQAITWDTPGCRTLAEAAQQPGTRLTLAVYRLPGWTGGAGYFISDGARYCTAIPVRGLPALRTWQPALLVGMWCLDEWGSGWFQVEQVKPLDESGEAKQIKIRG